MDLGEISPLDELDEVPAEQAMYSKKAIWGFSIFFAPIFGGVLLRQNLIERQNKKAANEVLLVSIACTVATALIINSLDLTGTHITMIFNAGGGAVLAEYYFKKYFPANNYEYKKIWKAFFISLGILIAVSAVIFIIFFQMT